MKSYFGCIMNKCKLLWKEPVSVSIIFVKHSVNGVAHAIARASSSVADRALVKEDLPSDALDVLLCESY